MLKSLHFNLIVLENMTITISRVAICIKHSNEQLLQHRKKYELYYYKQSLKFVSVSPVLYNTHIFANLIARHSPIKTTKFLIRQAGWVEWLVRN